MKKTSFLAFLLLFSLLFSACAYRGQTNNNDEKPRLKVVSTVFAPYDFVRQVVGDEAVEQTMLLSPGAEIHSFEPTAQDLIKIRECDLFLYIGGESDVWVESVLAGVPESVHTFKLLDCVSALTEEQSEGMQVSEEVETGEAEWDEHVWTSPRNASAIAQRICTALSALAPELSARFAENTAAYREELSLLDQSFGDVVQAGARHTVVFADRFPARYFTEAYGLSYDAAFPGCSSDTEPSAATLAFLTEKIRNEQIPSVFYIELSNRKTADAIARETGVKELLFHCCHNVTKAEFESGASYLSLMRANVEALRTALS